MHDKDQHDFMVTGVELAAGGPGDDLAVTLTDARGGKVRLHLSSDMAELLREKVSRALDRMEGP